jgi:transposase
MKTPTSPATKQNDPHYGENAWRDTPAAARLSLPAAESADRQFIAFINHRATQIKVLYFDRTGLCVWAKRLEQGRLVSDWRDASTGEIDWTALKCLLEGITSQRVKKRYQHAPLSSGIMG